MLYYTFPDMHKLEVDSVILNYGPSIILSDVYLKSETGNITGLLGRNGNGKSSLLNIIYGSLQPNQKFIRFDEHRITFAFKVPELISFLTQFNFIPKSFKISRVMKDFKLDFDALTLDLPELKIHYSSPLNTLSGGERRLLEMFVVLNSKSKFALLDEPFSQLSPVVIERVKEMILKASKNKGIIVTDHMYQEVIDISDDLYLAAAGKVHLIKHLDQLEFLGYLNPVNRSSGGV
jgi:ABC-type lipopolysaccharide export system ATPase subunit